MSKKDIFEDRSPVIRRDNTNFKNTRTELANTGSEYDHGNTSYLMNTMPAWIIDEDAKSGNELKNLSQIIGSYFDTLHIQISELNKTKDLRYLSGTLTGSSNEFPYNNRLLENQGLNTTEMFANADILERFFKRSDSKNFEQELQQIKSIIYKNIHNNLGYIYKSKGNEKAIRNLIRCYGIDQNIVSLNTYANNYAYELEDNYRTISSNKKYVDIMRFRWFRALYLAGTPPPVLRLHMRQIPHGLKKPPLPMASANLGRTKGFKYMQLRQQQKTQK